MAKKPSKKNNPVKEVEKIAKEVAKEAIESAPIPESLTLTPKKMKAAGASDDTIKLYMRSLVEELVPAMIAANNASRLGGTDAAAAKIKRWNVCNDCRQKGPPSKENPLGYPCKGNHIHMVVYPTRYPHFAKFFQGAQINGVRYISNTRRERVLIPADCESSITKMISDWEDNEMATMAGQRVAEHDSGDVREGGGGRVNTNVAQSTWR